MSSVAAQGRKYLSLYRWGWADVATARRKGDRRTPGFCRQSYGWVLLPMGGQKAALMQGGRQDPEVGLVVGQLWAHSMTNVSVRYVKMTIRRDTSSRKDDTKDDSLWSQKEATRSKGQKNVPRLEVDICLVNQNREHKLHVISRSGEGSRIWSQGNTSDRHTVTISQRKWWSTILQQCIVNDFIFLDYGRRRGRKMLTLNFQLIAIDILQNFALQKEEKEHYHGHCLFRLSRTEEFKYSKDCRITDS